MLIYLDTNIVIYAVENPAILGPKAGARLKAAAVAGDPLAVSDLVRLECRCRPLTLGDARLLADYDVFFSHPALRRAPFPTAVFDRATEIRARHGFKLGDSLHLAAAVEVGCGRFLTNDAGLSRFPDLTVEVLS